MSKSHVYVEILIFSVKSKHNYFPWSLNWTRFSAVSKHHKTLPCASWVGMTGEKDVREEGCHLILLNPTQSPDCCLYGHQRCLDISQCLFVPLWFNFHVHSGTCVRSLLLLKVNNSLLTNTFGKGNQGSGCHDIWITKQACTLWYFYFQVIIYTFNSF